MHQQGAVGAYQFGEMSEALEVFLLGAVDVEMVGIGGGDHGHVWCELVERAVEFIGLHHRYVGSWCEQEIGVPVAQLAAEECVDGGALLVEDVGGH